MASETMHVESEILRSLLVETKDGEWGGSEASADSVEMRVIRGTDFDDARNLDLSTVPVRHIAQRHATRKSLSAGDVLIETAGGSKGRPTGRTVFLREDLFRGSELPITCASFARFLRFDTARIEPEFAYWWLQSLYQSGQIETYQVQHSGIARFQFTKFAAEVRVPLPERGMQKQVVETLGTIERRVTLLRQTNATLESIAQALFKSWFSDFDPVRAKAEGLEPEGMDAATVALFPQEFEESALGSIPKGWRPGTLADVAELNARSWTAKRAPSEIAYVDLAGVKSNVFDAIQRFSFEEAPSRARRELRAGDTLVGTVRPGNRSFGFISEAEPGLTGSTGFAVLSPREPEATTFAYLCATRDENIERLAALADGGAYPAVRPEIVVATPCVLPSQTVLTKFASITGPLMQSIGANAVRAQTLADTRDTLLPRLISGKLRLPEAQEQLEDALA